MRISYNKGKREEMIDGQNFHSRTFAPFQPPELNSETPGAIDYTRVGQVHRRPLCTGAEGAPFKRLPCRGEEGHLHQDLE